MGCDASAAHRVTWRSDFAERCARVGETLRGFCVGIAELFVVRQSVPARQGLPWGPIMAVCVRRRLRSASLQAASWQTISA